MTRHSDRARIWHMLEYARKAVAMGHGHIREDLDTDEKLNLALTRLVEIIGEAAARVSRDTKDQMKEVPWGQIVALRNRLIHGYDSIDLDILWDIIQEDLPPLIESLEEALAE